MSEALLRVPKGVKLRKGKKRLALFGLLGVFEASRGPLGGPLGPLGRPLGVPKGPHGAVLKAHGAVLEPHGGDF